MIAKGYDCDVITDL